VKACFLEMAAFSNGEIVNYTNIAADCGVSNDLFIRKTGDCLVMPWQTFLERLWAGGIFD